MSKRGQVTVFVIVGIVILFVIGLGVFLASSKPDFLKEITTIQSVPADVQPIKEKIDNCLDDVSVSGLIVLGRRGGYYEMPNNALIDFGIDYYENSTDMLMDLRTYYFDKGNITLPKLEFIKQQYTKYIENGFNDCVSKLNLSVQGYDMTVKKADASVDFKNNITLISVTMPINLKKEDTSFNFKKFSKQINFDFPSKYFIVQGILVEQKKTPNYIVLGDITNIAYNNNFKFEINQISVDPNSRLVTLIFNETALDEFRYSFVMRYDW